MKHQSNQRATPQVDIASHYSKGPLKTLMLGLKASLKKPSGECCTKTTCQVVTSKPMRKLTARTTWQVGLQRSAGFVLKNISKDDKCVASGKCTGSWPTGSVWKDETCEASSLAILLSQIIEKKRGLLLPHLPNLSKNVRPL